MKYININFSYRIHPSTIKPPGYEAGSEHEQEKLLEVATVSRWMCPHADYINYKSTVQSILAT